MTNRLDDAALLDLATLGRTHQPGQALALARAGGVAAPEALALGARDAALLRLRAARFGPVLACVETCPACAAPLEFELDVAELLALCTVAEPEEVDLPSGRRWLRPLSTVDLLAAMALPRTEAQRALAEAAAAGAVEDADLAAIEAWLEAADPMACLTLDLDCAACGAAWGRPLDIASLFWAEAVADGRRVLREVHAMACAYGWREAEVLALPPARRQLYLEMIGA